MWAVCRCVVSDRLVIHHLEDGESSEMTALSWVSPVKSNINCKCVVKITEVLFICLIFADTNIYTILSYTYVVIIALSDATKAYSCFQSAEIFG